MGGDIGVDSVEDQGSEFWFTVLLDKQPAGTGAQTEICLPADLGGVRVLVVDDNATSREILFNRLTLWGMRPAAVEDGPTALRTLLQALAENDPFRIAVIDMQMPDMDGEMVGRSIKEDNRLVDTRMVMLTSLGTRGDAQHFLDIGFSAYLTKPARHQELFNVLSMVLADQGGMPVSTDMEVSVKPLPQPILTRHSAHDLLRVFAGSKARILVAEDNITNQQVALGILKKLGLRADAVADGAEAVKALESIPYDMVLMDVQMPVMDGFEATRLIRDLHSVVLNHDIPIISMTAHAMQG